MFKKGEAVHLTLSDGSELEGIVDKVVGEQVLGYWREVGCSSFHNHRLYAKLGDRKLRPHPNPNWLRGQWVARELRKAAGL